MEPKVEEFISLGYRITRFVEPPGYSEEWWSTRGRETFVSISPCLANQSCPDAWCFEEQGLHDEIVQSFGVRGDSRTAVRDWNSRSNPDFGFPDTFRTVVAARAFISEFLEPVPGRLLIGFGVHQTNWDQLMIVADDARSALPAGCGENSSMEFARERRPLAGGGERLGYDVIEFDFVVPNHSWYCGGHDAKVRDRFGVTANQFGLIETFAEARQCAEYIDDPATPSEPGKWLPVAVVRYPDATHAWSCCVPQPFLL